MLSKNFIIFSSSLISSFKLMAASSRKSKVKAFGSVVVTNFLSPIMIMTWLNCCKLFWWFHCVDTKDKVFDWFSFLVCMTGFQRLFLLKILEAWLIVCFGLRFCFLFLFSFRFRGFNFTISPIISSSSDFEYSASSRKTIFNFSYSFSVFWIFS